MKRIAVALVAFFALAVITRGADEARGIQIRQEAQVILGENTAIPSYHALVIGINRYKNWQDLRQARPDAEEVAGLLKRRYGFGDVQTLYDEAASKDGLTLGFRRLARRLGEGDSLLVFYSGHGYYDKMLNSGYWVPSDARERVDGEPATMDWFSNKDLKGCLAAMKARHVLVFSDSCFSGALFRGVPADLSAKGNEWYRRAIAQPSRWAISSGDLENVPDDSVFARKVIAALQYPLKPVFSASDLAGQIKTEVASGTGCQPLFGRLADDRDSQLGEFVFLLASAESEGTDPAPEPPGAAPLPESPSGPSVIQYTGSLVVESPAAGSVQVDGGKAYPIQPGRALKWETLSVGTHAVAVTAGGKTWRDSITIRRDQTMTARAVFGAAPGQPWVNSLGMEFVPVPGTDVLFCKWETRVQDFEAFVKETGHDATEGMYSLKAGSWGQNGATWKSPGFTQSPTHPVCGVSWEDAQTFCKWLTDKERREGKLQAGQSYRLPQDWEWSVAVGLNESRTGTPKDKDEKSADVYPWGTQWPPPTGAGNYAGSEAKDNDWSPNWSTIDGYRDAYPRTAPVGSFTAGKCGLYDLSGNLWEWCEDYYDGSSRARVLRGGSWDFYVSRSLLSSYRLNYDPDDRGVSYGFRCVLVLSSR